MSYYHLVKRGRFYIFLVISLSIILLLPSAPVFAAETPPLPPGVPYGDEVALMNDLWNSSTKF